MTLLSIALLVVSSVVVQQSFASQAAPATRRYIVKKTAQPLVIDGRLSESQWKACEPIKLTAYKEGLSIEQQTSAFILWDDNYLYIAFICEDNHIWYTLDQRDQFLWVEEVVEVYLNPDGDRETYLELQVNPVETLFDGYIINRNGIRDLLLAWNSTGIKRAVAVEGTLNDPSDRDKGWTVEIAIPLEDEPTGRKHGEPVMPGDKWRINLYRIDRPCGKAEPAKPHEYSAWSPVSGSSFHDPDQFAEIEFSGETLP
ncbi:MAG: carbohydrate-binding family 9-like protein [Gemmatimonadota bacterium]|nr:carbohydrate-binding family 9-like protein [Gemmatimonadota bacterium]